jgi:hypothetical protein
MLESRQDEIPAVCFTHEGAASQAPADRIAQASRADGAPRERAIWRRRRVTRSGEIDGDLLYAHWSTVVAAAGLPSQGHYSPVDVIGPRSVMNSPGNMMDVLQLHVAESGIGFDQNSNGNCPHTQQHRGGPMSTVTLIAVLLLCAFPSAGFAQDCALSGTPAWSKRLRNVSGDCDNRFTSPNGMLILLSMMERDRDCRVSFAYSE